MRRRIFVKLFAAFTVVIAAAAVTTYLSLREAEEASSGLGRGVLLGTGLALLIASSWRGSRAQSTSQRLQSIVQFAREIAAGKPGGAHRGVDSGDEIGQVAAAVDETASQLEEDFAALRTSQHQLETLLNSMQDAVLAVDEDERVQWANQAMDRLVASENTRRNAPVVETVRDPDFLHAVREASKQSKVCTSRAASILPGRTFDVTAAPLPGGGAVVVLRDQTETERIEKTRRDFIANVSHELRTPLTSIQGYTETLVGQRRGEQWFPRVPGSHPQERHPHGAPDGGFTDLGPGGIRRAAFRYAAGGAGDIACRKLCRTSVRWRGTREWNCRSKIMPKRR